MSQSEDPSIGGDGIFGVLADQAIQELGRRQALQRIADAEEAAGRGLPTEERLKIIEGYESDLMDAVRALETSAAPLEQELAGINNRGSFGKLRGIPRAWRIGRELESIERAINSNLLRRRGAAIAREQVLGRIRRYPGDPI